jgi:REP element-mobilizing transposase RayT
MVRTSSRYVIRPTRSSIRYVLLPFQVATMQLDLPLPAKAKWGGARKGAGRKPSGKKAMLAHRARPSLASRHPVHVTLRLLPGLESLRTKNKVLAIRAAMRAAKVGAGFRLVHFTIQGNHLHLLVEAKDSASLSRGVAALEIRIARTFNRLCERSGRVFADRFHARALKTPKEVRACLAYVLLNSNRHAAKANDRLDPCASGLHFDGWKTVPVDPPKLGDEDADPPVTPAGTWLLAVGWRTHGLLRPSEVPKG